MRMRRYVLPCLALLAMLLQTSCGGRSERAAMLLRADSLMSVSPSLALGYTDSLLTTGRGGDHWRAQLQLRCLNAKNKLDTVFNSHHVDEAKTLVEHFDRSGTPNERMLAHYLLGRTYADTHEAPMALEAYQDAAACADTTAADCNYNQLCRVYSQMAEIFYGQGLFHNTLSSLDQSMHYGKMAKDTIGVLLIYMQKLDAYKQIGDNNSMLFVCEDVSTKLRDIGQRQLAATVMASPARILLQKGEIEKARLFIDTYEKESGYFDSQDNIEEGREIFYNIKGCYFLSAHQYDSAEYYFRKELRDGPDYNNQNCGSHGLAQLFQQTHRLDSATKYALYSHQMCDSFYAQRATDAVTKTKELYDYSRHQLEAQQEKERADARSRELLVAGLITIIILLVLGIVVYKYRVQLRRRKEEGDRYLELRSTYEQTLSELANLRSHVAEYRRLANERDAVIRQQEQEKDSLHLALAEVERLRENEDKLNNLIRKKEMDAANQQAQLARLKERLRDTSSRKEESDLDRLNMLEAYRKLMEKCNQGRKLTLQDWASAESILLEVLPEFYQFVSFKKLQLSDYEYKVCLLTRLYVPAKTCAHFIGIDPSYVTKIRISLNEKLFGEKGNSKEFDHQLRNIG